MRRVYNALLRAGFEEADVRSELDPHVRTMDDGVEAGAALDGTTNPSDYRWKETGPDDDSQ